MSTKLLIFIGMTVGGAIGGYVPALFGVDLLSFSSIFWSGIGSLVGVWAGYKLSKL